MGKKKGHGGGGGHDAAGGLRWLLTYADLITLLLVFFIVIAAISKPDVKKVESLGVAFSKVFGVFPAASPSHMSGFGSGKGLLPYNRPSQDVSLNLVSQLESLGTRGVNVETRKKMVIVRISGLILFGPNDAQLLPQARQVLDRVGGFLKLVTNKFTIQGHTDPAPASGGQYPTNWELSAARALNVGHYLMDNHRIEPHRITVSGRAEQEPLTFEQLTPGENEPNRRVDIVIDLDQ
ncbi:flagellar motor protein MotB [bacterium]|nr:flagellar motor protein MotB [bacterium]